MPRRGRCASRRGGWASPTRRRAPRNSGTKPTGLSGNGWTAPFWLSKKWLAPLFRGVHSSLAPTARPGSYARKPLLRKAFCGFDAHVAKSDQSLKWLRSSIRQRFLDRLRAEPIGSALLVFAALTRRFPAFMGLPVPIPSLARRAPGRYSPTAPALPFPWPGSGSTAGPAAPYPGPAAGGTWAICLSLGI